jgi:subtilisin family serine protease
MDLLLGFLNTATRRIKNNFVRAEGSLYPLQTPSCGENMRWMYPCAGVILLMGFTAPAWPQILSYSCRNQTISFELVPAAAAIEAVAGKSLDYEKALSGLAAATISLDEKHNRSVLLFDSAEAAAEARAQKSASLSFFPVYRYVESTSPSWAFGEILARLREESARDELIEFAEDRGLQIEQGSRTEPEIFLLRASADAGRNEFQWASEIAGLPFVQWAEPNLYGGMRLHVNDPLRVNQNHLDLIQADRAWSVTTGSPSVVVALLDEGIDINHPDLSSNVWSNPLDTDDGLDNDGNGLIDDFHGWDFFGSDEDVRPTGGGAINAHGTAVAGVVAAVQNNSLGVSGVAPGCKVLACRLFDGSSFAGTLQAGEAIRYAALHADVINGSWGGGSPSNDIMDAIDFAVVQGRGGKGCPVFFASGNQGGNAVDFPANYVWSAAVGETNARDGRHYESDMDSRLCLMAPTSAWTTDISGVGGFDDPLLDYTSQFGGTSSSCPVASAVAALILSRHPGITGVQAVLSLIATADNPMVGITPNDRYGKSLEMGYGRVNAGRAVLAGDDFIDDRLEPNDSLETAAEIRPGFYPWLYLGEDPDIYSFHSPAGQPIHCAIQYLSLFGNLGIILKDSGLNVIANHVVTSQGNTSTSTIDISAPSDGTYYLQVFPITGVAAPYTLEVQAYSVDDPFEPNQALAQAMTLNPGSGTTYQDLAANDDDYYQVHLDADQYLYAMITFDANQSDLELQILDDAGGVVRNSIGPGFGRTVSAYKAPDTEDYYVRIYKTSSTPNREYSMHLAVSAAGPITTSGADDPYEENDTVATAADLPGGFYPNLALDDFAGEVRDLFRFTAPADKEVRVTVGWNGVPDVDLYLYGPEVLLDPPNTPPLARSVFTSRDVESVHIPAVHIPTEYYLDILRVTGLGHTPYQLSIEFIEPTPNAPVASFRFCEGDLGATADSYGLRDWSGSLLSHSPTSYGGVGNWVSGPSPDFFPGSDGIALDCSMGGFYFPSNGDRGDLSLGDRSLSVWARIKPKDVAASRSIAGIPNAWKFSIRADNTLDFSTGTGPTAPVFAGSGPAMLVSEWQDVACVWDRTAGLVKVYLTGPAGLVERTAPIGARTIVGGAPFHIGSDLGGIEGVGLIEQIQLYPRALTAAEISRISSGPIPARNENWGLYE